MYAKFFKDKVPLFSIGENLFLLPIYAIMIGLTGYFVIKYWLKLTKLQQGITFQQSVAKVFTVVLLLMPMNLLLLLGGWGLFLFVLVIPIVTLVMASVYLSDESPGQAVSEGFGLLGNGFSQLASLSLSVFVLSALILLLGDMMPQLINLDILDMFIQLDDLAYVNYQAGVVLFFFFTSVLMVFALLFTSSIMLYYSLREQNLANGLRGKLLKVGLLDEK